MTTPLVEYEGLAKTAAPAAFIPTYTVGGWGEYRDKKGDLERGGEIVSNVEYNSTADQISQLNQLLVVQHKQEMNICRLNRMVKEFVNLFFYINKFISYNNS